MKKIGNKVFLMIIIFVLIFGLNTVFSIRMQNSIKQAGLQITKQYIPIQTEIFTIQKSILTLSVCMMMQSYVNSWKVH